MEQRKPWQFWLIIAVVVLTLINIFPTIRYYTQPLRAPVAEDVAMEVAANISERLQRLEQDSVEWIQAFAKHIGTSPTSVKIVEEDPKLVEVNFESSTELERFSRLLAVAGSRIPFVPAQLTLSRRQADDALRTIYVERNVGTRIDSSELNAVFDFGEKFDEEGLPMADYRDLTYDRVSQLALLFAGPSAEGQALAAIDSLPFDQRVRDAVIELSQGLVEANDRLSDYPGIRSRILNAFARTESDSGKNLINGFLAKIEQVKSGLQTELTGLQAQEKELGEAGQFLGTEEQQRLRLLNERVAMLDEATRLIRQESKALNSASSPLDEAGVMALLNASEQEAANPELQLIDLSGRTVFVEKILIDWSNDRLILSLYPDVQELLTGEAQSEGRDRVQEYLRKEIFDLAATASQITDETLTPQGGELLINLAHLGGSRSFLTLKLGALAEKQVERVTESLLEQWNPRHSDLQRDVFPIWTWEEYQQLQAAEQQLGLLVFTPAETGETPPTGFDRGSVYVVARGLQFILEKYQQDSTSPDAQLFIEDVRELNRILEDQGMFGYPGTTAGVAQEFRNDTIFARTAFYQNLLAATREDFQVRGSKQYAVLEFSDYEQRLNTTNRIDNQVHEDLLKWKEAYQTTQVDLEPARKLLVPPPTRNVYWENLKLTMRKYFRGDETQVLKWGLDLQGGKTVRLGLRDENNRPVTDPEQLQQAVNDLYTRINRLGVSEQTIRVENDKIVLEFPGSQGLTAADLIRASAMYLHLVNEKFGPFNPQLADVSDRFLQGVWNEAVVTNRTDEAGVNEIAWRQLGGDPDDIEAGLDAAVPSTADARTLLENGLRLAHPERDAASSRYDDSLSKIAIQRVDDQTEQTRAHPLMVVYNNFALEGASLTGIQVGYDATRGNYLSFAVQSSYPAPREGDPRDDFFAWTSQFSRNAVANTAKQLSSELEGWRLAVILNGQVVSAPRLSASLRDSGVIEGGFTQRQVNRLAADLRAGSLKFTPRILSETNVSPDLGSQERVRGIASALMGLVLVVFAMVGCYRFAGMIAATAVIFNLLILWGVLQNLDAALTLPGIAGVILTVGMAVDANVLVFERIREEFKNSGRLSSAISAGYRKAFSAIVDSNLTTIIAALILIQFDAGPIKGFAVTLIIGIASSMFTALFMTRYFFTGWVQRSKAAKLEMREIFKPSKFEFLKYAKTMVAISMTIMVLGGALGYMQQQTILGMEFTGGYSLNMELEESDGLDYRNAVKDALTEAGAYGSDFQVRRLNKANQLKIQFGNGMEEEGRPFADLPIETEVEGVRYAFENNPRIAWTVDALSAANLEIKEAQLTRLDQNWSVMSGQFSSVMRDNALMAVGAAILCILLYITVRFEFKYGIAAIVALIHDVFVTLGILGLLHYIGVPIQFDLEVLGAMMTIIGYSLNDTIIIFDRVREDVRIYRKLSFVEVVNHAINITLSRTIMTSATTLLVLMPLVLFGGSAIFPFALVMTIGVVIGTLSSLFIAAPVMIYFHKREHNGHASVPAMNGA